MVALVAGRAAGKGGARVRPWRCLSPNCGKQLGEKVQIKGGYARLLIDFATARRVEVCGHEVRVTCPKCGAVKVWHTSAPESVQSA